MAKKQDKRTGKAARVTRRKFLAKTGAVGTAYAVGGGIAGNFYRRAREGLYQVGHKLADLDQAVETSKNPVVKNVVKPVKNVEDWRARFWRNVFGRSEEDTEEWRKGKGYQRQYQESPERKATEKPTKPEEKTLTRRNFWQEAARYVLGTANKYPETTGAIVAGAYGTGKAALRGKKEYRTARTIAQTQDENTALSERVEQLEQRVQGKYPGTTGNFAIIGLIGIVISILLSSANLTGFVIINETLPNLQVFNLCLFLLSLLSILISRFF